MARLIAIRLLPVLLVMVAAGLWISDVEEGGQYVARNLVPMAVVLVLAGLTVWRGNGHWTGSGWRLLLGTVGFAIPALGLSAYLHYAYSINLNDLFTGASDPQQLFRFLPIYTTVAGCIGFAIGWIVGRNL